MRPWFAGNHFPVVYCYQDRAQGSANRKDTA